MRIRTGIAAVLLSVTLCIPSLGQAQSRSTEQLGKVHFLNSCSPAVQETFQRSVAMLHSFWYTEAEKTFREVLARDPSCAIATWGIAAILMSNPLGGVGPPPHWAERAQELAQLRDALQAAKNDYWASEVEVSRLAAAAWTAWARGRHDEALNLMQRAADIEDTTEKHIVTPGRILPARELLGDMLLELKRPAEALQQFEASQRREPDRFRGLYGAAQAAAQSGDIAKAKGYFSRLVEIAGQGDPRPALAQARAFLAATR